MSTTETWTIGKLLTWTTDYLKKGGSTSPRLDAEVLLAHACGRQRIELYTTFDQEPAEEARVAFRELVRRRNEGSPVAYLVGYKEFYSMQFEVNPDVLIPRPETEHLVVAALDRAKELESPSLNIVDVGTGSGAIAVTVAKHLRNCHVTAIDKSPAALVVARRNAEKHQLGDDRIAFLESDLLAAVPADTKFDLVLSNPPYVSQAEYEQLPATVRNFEPQMALVSGPDGSELIARLLIEAHARLNPRGYCIFEFSPMLNQRLATFVGTGWDTPQVTKDLAGLARIVTLRKST
jgi:release factor glutamine methyltransferase